MHLWPACFTVAMPKCVVNTLLEQGIHTCIEPECFLEQKCTFPCTRVCFFEVYIPEHTLLERSIHTCIA